MIHAPQEVIDGIKAVRDSGKTNMFDVKIVCWIARRKRFHRTATWIMNHRSEYAKGIFEGFSVEPPSKEAQP